MIERLEHLAICAPNWVGDLAMATPVLEAALASAHVARTTILVRKHLAPLLADGPWARTLAPHGPSATPARAGWQPRSTCPA